MIDYAKLTPDFTPSCQLKTYDVFINKTELEGKKCKYVDTDHYREDKDTYEVENK